MLKENTLFIRKEQYGYNGLMEMLQRLIAYLPQAATSISSLSKDTRSRLHLPWSSTQLWTRAQLSQIWFCAFTTLSRQGEDANSGALGDRVEYYCGPGTSIGDCDTAR